MNLTRRQKETLHDIANADEYGFEYFGKARVRIVNNLRRHGLVTVTRNHSALRSAVVQLTADGRKVLSDLSP